MKLRPILHRVSLCVFLMSVIAMAHPWRMHSPDPYHGSCPRRPIDLVICLDTSGSMNGLIDSARAKLWDIVNDLGKVRPAPVLRVGLLTYGSPGRSPSTAGYIVRRSDLTGDLDLIYERMMGLGTEGGAEFVGWVLSDAVRTMSWSPDPRGLKLIFVAGNESADQAVEVVNFRTAAAAARSAGITVNAVYCGNWQAGVFEGWQELSRHGGGEYSAIDMARGVSQTETPYDQRLLELNIELNATYVPFGRHGDAGRQRLLDQDAHAAALGPQSAGSRVTAKSSALYVNQEWDLVDASKESKFEWREVEREDLPAAMQSMNEGERIAYVERMSARRAELQREIQGLGIRRDAHLKEEQKKTSGGQAGFDEALQQAIRKQAEAGGFRYQE